MMEHDEPWLMVFANFCVIVKFIFGQLVHFGIFIETIVFDTEEKNEMGKKEKNKGGFHF
jgi:uncharacterized membrane protein YhaH (DUF805 family)